MIAVHQQPHRIIDNLLDILEKEGYISAAGESQYEAAVTVVKEFPYMVDYVEYGFVGFEIVKKSKKPTTVDAIIIQEKRTSLDLETLVAGRYRIVSRLGQGGMSTVYRAYDIRTGHDVALKMLLSQVSHDDSFITRFQQEASRVKRLDHPNIVKVFDTGRATDGVYYFTMEYFDGGSLDELIARTEGALESPIIVNIASQISAALDHAHARELIHRDIKPSNVLLTADCMKAVLSDFGIAKAVSSSKLTQTGRFVGTLEYTSPEQAEGRPASPASDLYSLGVVLYEMATGRVPFTAENPYGILYKHINTQPTLPRELNPDVPPELEEIILKLLAKAPGERCQSAADLLAALNMLKETVSLPSAIPEMARTADAGREREPAASILQGKIETSDFDVFLCYNSEDKLAVKEIGERLRERGILPWLDEWELQPGLPWQRLLEQQIGQIKSAAVFVGKGGIGPWQRQELDAFLREFAHRRCPVIPVLLPDAPTEPKLPIFLRGMTWVDFRKDDPEPMEQLIWGITGERDRAF